MENISKCPICKSNTHLLFEVNIFGVNRKLLECTSLECKQAFFDNVTWLDRAYSSAIADLDTGAVRRCLSIRKLIASVVSINANNSMTLDYGGGPGLLTRLLRDVGINCYHYDKYCSNVYAGSFEGIDTHYDVVTMVEVIEHLMNPIEDLETIFRKYTPNLVIATTVLRPAILDKSWWYLTPSTGQHINFYTSNSLKKIGRILGYHVLISGTTVIFYKEEINPFRKYLLKFSLNRYIKYIAYTYRSIFYRSSTQKDFESLRQKNDSCITTMLK
jgi:hypothetical protein